MHFRTDRFTFKKIPPPPPLLHPSKCEFTTGQKRWSFPLPFGEWHSRKVRESLRVLPFPVNSHSHSHSLKIPWGRGRVNHSSHDFPAKKNRRKGDPTHTVTEIWGHCSEGLKRWGHSSSLIFLKKNFILERLENLKNCNFLTQTASPTRKRFQK